MLTNNEPQATQDFFAALHRAYEALERAEELLLLEQDTGRNTGDILQQLATASNMIDNAGQAIVNGTPEGETAPDAVIVEISA